MTYFERVGKVALGSKLRFLSERLTEDAAEIFSLYGIRMNPKWFPVFHVLSMSRDRTITSIAEEIGHSHASVSKIIAEMRQARLISGKSGPGDRRCNILNLSKQGEKYADRIAVQCADVTAALDDLVSEATHDLWKALQEWDYLLARRTLFQRVRDKKKERESRSVRIVPYNVGHQLAFRKLNEDWITTYFKMEKADREALNDPKGHILDRGGFIFVATIDEKAVGVCALIRRDDPKYPYELAKMAVSAEMRGRNIGWLLGNAAIKRARSVNAARLYLESNTILKPAIRLYEKLGFRKIVGPPTPYERCNIQMELDLRHSA